MPREEGETPERFMIVLTEEQCEYLASLFLERVETHRIREMTGYPQDEEGARFAEELWMAVLSALPEESGNGAKRRQRVM
jgi:hypothetical protein